jgi:hypothetical protein
MSYETNEEKNGMGTKMLITIYIPNSFIVNIPTTAPLAISYLVSFPVDIFYFFESSWFTRPDVLLKKITISYSLMLNKKIHEKDYTCKHFKTVLQNKSTGAVIAVIIW